MTTPSVSAPAFTALRPLPKTAIYWKDDEISYADLLAHSAALASLYFSAPGERVVVFSENRPEWISALFSIWRNRCTLVPVDSLGPANELAYILGQTEPVALFCSAKTRPVVEEALRALPALAPRVICFDSEDFPAMPSGAITDAPLMAGPADALAAILFTSGTTGRPKAIVHTHGGRWTAHLLQRAVLPFTPGAGDRVLLMTPFVHGASLIAAAWLEQGGEVVLQDGVKAERIAPILDAGPSAIFAPPTVLAKILSLFPDRRFEGVRCIFTGTSTLSRELWRRAADAFGPVVRITYGMSECFNPITVLEPPEVAAAMAEADDGLGANLGWPAPGVEIAIRAEDGTALPPGEPGEIHLRGRHMAAGTITGTGFTARPPGGWHRTGDLGAIDARGRLRLSGRAADLMKSGGYRVHPGEIESVLDGAAEGRAICVLGLPSDYWGEVIVAVAEAPPEGWVAEAETRVAALARHKRPRAWLALPELPRNAQGKVVRARVRDAILAAHALEDGPRPRLLPRATK